MIARILGVIDLLAIYDEIAAGQCARRRACRTASFQKPQAKPK
jgi:hypothetical protein